MLSSSRYSCKYQYCTTCSTSYRSRYPEFSDELMEDELSLMTAESSTKKTRGGGVPSLVTHPVSPTPNSDPSDTVAIITKPVGGDCLHLGRDIVGVVHLENQTKKPGSPEFNKNVSRTALYEGGRSASFCVDRSIENQTLQSIESEQSIEQSSNEHNNHPIYDGHSKVPISAVVNTFRVGSSSRRVRAASTGSGNISVGKAAALVSSSMTLNPESVSVGSNKNSHPGTFALPSLSAYGLSVGNRAHTASGTGNRKSILNMTKKPM